MKLTDIRKLLNAEYSGTNQEKEITGVAKIEEASPEEISFLANPLYEKFIHSTSAGAVLVKKNFKAENLPGGLDLLYVDDPYISFLTLLETFNKVTVEFKGISDRCYIDAGSEIPKEVSIGNFTNIGKNFRLGEKSIIYSNCSIGNNVTIGRECMIYPNVSIYDGSIIGDRVIIHSGTVIGSDGFGFAKEPDSSFKKIPQTGIVHIEDDVEIGSNTSIDRATMGETHIGKGVKIDNLVQIAHNVSIGENSAIASGTGIAGSTKVGRRCLFGGKVGIVGHLTICDDVIVTAGTNVSKSISKAGMYSGYRAKEMRAELKEESYISKIGEMYDRLKNLENKIK